MRSSTVKNARHAAPVLGFQERASDLEVDALADSLAASRVSRAEAVARALETTILDGKLAPGDRLGTKKNLQQSFGVAVATVNEAVRLLEVRGLVKARPGPGGGVFVASQSARTRSSRALLGFRWSSTKARDCARVRLALDHLIVEDAVAFRTADDVAELRRLLALMADAIDDPAKYLVHDWALHRALGNIARNEPLRAIYRTLLDFQEMTLATAPAPEFDRAGNFKLHVALVDAIEAQNHAAAAKAEARHRAAALVDD